MSAARFLALVLVGTSLALIPAGPAAAVPCLELAGVSDRCEDWSRRESIGWGEDVLADPAHGRVYVAATALGPSGDTNGDIYLHAYDAATGAELWSLSRDGGAAGYDAANDLVLSEDGGRLCLSGGVAPGAGPIPGIPSGYDVLVLCVRPLTGEVLWERTYDMPTGRDDTADGGMVEARVPLPDGTSRDMLFVGGFSGHAPLGGDPSEKDLLTLAIDPTNGDLLWSAMYDGPAGKWEVGRGIGVSPDGRRVFVTGESSGNGTSHDYATVAYDAVTGDELWVARHEGLGGDLADEPNALVVSPTGDIVVVTGGSEDSAGAFRWATVAYDADTGAQRWAARHAGTPPPAPVPEDVRPTFFQNFHLTGRDDEANALAFAPDGATVYVTGFARAFPNGTDYVTVAYDAATGSADWTETYDGPIHRLDEASDVIVSPSGDRIYVTGNSADLGYWQSGQTDTPSYVLDDVATVAYDPSGTRQWVARYDAAGYLDSGSALALGGNSLYVAGMGGWVDEFGDGHVDPLTLAYAA